MKIEKVVKIDEELEFSGITLLTAEEYEEYEDNIPRFVGWWWLRSPGSDWYLALGVQTDGSITHGAVDYDYGSVRPALRICDLKSSNLKIGDQFYLAGVRWTIISDELALCDSEIRKYRFRKNWEAADANDYNASDVKKYVEKWAKKHGIEIVA